MKRIEKLTPEQIAKFPDYVREWTAYGTSTEPADKPRAEAAIRKMYEIANLPAPKIIWCDSPISMALTKLVLEKMPASVGASVGASVRDSVRASVWDSVGASVWDSVGASVRASVGASVRASVYGQHDAHWLAFYRFFRDECGLIEQTMKLDGLWELCQSCGWVLPFGNVCFASGRHDICKLDERGRIHNETGPAIHYVDGFSVYAWRGTRVPAEWIEQRATLDPATVLKSENVEQRAAGAAIIGWPRMAKSLKRKVIDGDPDSDIGALIELTLPGLREPGRFLQAVCPRNGTICEGVPRSSDIDGLPIETAIAAQAWRDGIPAAEYQHPPIRT